MNTRRIIVTILIMIALLLATLLIVINIKILKEISAGSFELKGKHEARESSVLNYAIPSDNATGYQVTENAIAGIAEKRNALKEQEAETEHARSVRRAEAFAGQKKLEASLQASQPSLPRKEPPRPSEEEVKALEKKGAIPF
jgi:hypothetical protein